MSSFIDTDKTVQAMQFTLDGLAKRTQVASNDISNADTPNFKSSEVTFEGSLRQALQGGGDYPMRLTLTDGADIDPNTPAGLAQISETPLYGRVLKNDNNNVDVDREMTTLAESNILYDTMTQLAETKLGILKSTITDTKP